MNTSRKRIYLKKRLICLLFLVFLIPKGNAQVGPPPTITAQPQDTNALYGGTVTFGVAASSGTTISYQWYKSAQKLTGQTYTNLVLANVGDADAAQYYVTVKNASGTVSSRLATLTISSNSAPVARNDSYPALINTPLIIDAASGVLTNDTDYDGQALTVELLTNVLHGSLNLNTNGSFSYMPGSNYLGSDLFTYRASDGYPSLLEQNNSGGRIRELKNGETAAQSFVHGTTGGTSYMIDKLTVYISREPKNGNGNVTISLGTGVNSGTIAGSSVSIPPSAITDTSQGETFQTYDIVFNTPVGPFFAGSKYYLNIDNETGKKMDIEYTNTDSYANGTFYFNGGDQHADMRFQLYAPTTSNPATVAINVTSGISLIGNNDTFVVLEDTPLSVPAPGVLANDTSSITNPLSALLVSNVIHGLLNFNTNGSFIYLPSTNYNGTDSFTYRPKDSVFTGSVATVTLTVRDTQTPLKILSSQMTSEGFSLNISCPWGYICVVEASSNLVDWVPIYTNSTYSTSVMCVDAAITNFPSKFYRAVSR